jgi:hypothetical protein
MVEAVRVSSIWTVTLAVGHVAVPLVQQAFEIETKISLALDVAFPRIFAILMKQAIAYMI